MVFVFQEGALQQALVTASEDGLVKEWVLGEEGLTRCTRKLVCVCLCVSTYVYMYMYVNTNMHDNSSVPVVKCLSPSPPSSADEGVPPPMGVPGDHWGPGGGVAGC